jgi:hypothetical protein
MEFRGLEAFIPSEGGVLGRTNPSGHPSLSKTTGKGWDREEMKCRYLRRSVLPNQRGILCPNPRSMLKGESGGRLILVPLR